MLVIQLTCSIWLDLSQPPAASWLAPATLRQGGRERTGLRGNCVCAFARLWRSAATLLQPAEQDIAIKRVGAGWEMGGWMCVSDRRRKKEGICVQCDGLTTLTLPAWNYVLEAWHSSTCQRVIKANTERRSMGCIRIHNWASDRVFFFSLFFFVIFFGQGSL